MSHRTAAERATCEGIFYASALLAKEAAEEGKAVYLDGLGTLFHYTLRYFQDHGRDWLNSAGLLFSLHLHSAESPARLVYADTPAQGGLWRSLRKARNGDIGGIVCLSRPSEDTTVIGLRSREVIFSVVASPLSSALEPIPPLRYSVSMNMHDADPFRLLKSRGLAALREWDQHANSKDAHDQLCASITRLANEFSTCHTFRLSIVLLGALARLAHSHSAHETAQSDFFLLRLAFSLQQDAKRKSVPDFFFEIDDWNHSAEDLFGERGYRELVGKIERVLSDSEAEAASKWERSLGVSLSANGLVQEYKAAFRFYRDWLKESLNRLDGPGRVGLLTPTGQLRELRRPSYFSEPSSPPSPSDTRAIAPFTGPRSAILPDSSAVSQEEQETHAGTLVDWMQGEAEKRRPSLAPTIPSFASRSRSPFVEPGPEYQPERRGSVAPEGRRGSLRHMTSKIFKKAPTA